ncbi:MAG TPA: hypothetical protein VF499_13355, partial [Afipia sp.]
MISITGPEQFDNLDAVRRQQRADLIAIDRADAVTRYEVHSLPEFVMTVARAIQRIHRPQRVSDAAPKRADQQAAD